MNIEDDIRVGLLCKTTAKLSIESTSKSKSTDNNTFNDLEILSHKNPSNNKNQERRKFNSLGMSYEEALKRLGKKGKIDPIRPTPDLENKSKFWDTTK